MRHLPEKYGVFLLIILGFLASSCSLVINDPWNAGKTACPEFSQASGTFSRAFLLTISSSTETASIRYTLDGSLPTRNHGILYTGPLTVASSLTIKAVAWTADLEDSVVATAIYTLYPQASATPGVLPTPSPLATQSPSPDPTASPTPQATAAGTSLAGTIKGISESGTQTTSAVLVGARIELWNGSVLQSTATSGPDGTFRFSGLAASTVFRLEVSADSWLPVTLYGISTGLSGETWIQTVSLVSDAFAKGDGTASGCITDALTGSGLAGVTLSLRAGINNLQGTVVAQGSTAAGGIYSFAGLDSGIYTVTASKSGYIDTNYTLLFICTKDMPNQNASISSTLSGGGFRVVLTWGESPADLDIHMAVPSLTYPHVYFNRKGSGLSDPWTTLDVDDTTGLGPETITVGTVSTGTYTCYVHDYSNRNQTASSVLAASMASVRVYQGESLLYTFNVPAQEGTLWKVFTFDGSTITPVNSMMYEASSAGLTSRSVAASGERAWFAGLPAK